MIFTFIAVRDELRKEGLGSEIVRRFRDETVVVRLSAFARVPEFSASKVTRNPE